MSYKAEIEIALQLHWFKNIQIDRQGYVAIRIQLYDQSAPNINYALPYYSLTVNKSMIEQEPTIEDNAFHSSTLKIRYADQKYYINDIVQFKLMVESVPNLSTSKIYIKFTLLFASLNSYSKSMDPVVNGMESVIMKLENIQNGILSYCETQFTEGYASSLGYTLFAMIIDYKLYPYSMRKQVISENQQERKRQKERQKINYFQDLLIWSSKYMIPKQQKPLVYFYENYAKNLRYISYQMKQRVSEHLKNKKQVQLKLPSFYKENGKVQNKQFYQFFSNFDASGITIKIFQKQIVELHQQNYFFAQSVKDSMSKGLFDLQKLQKQYADYVFSRSHARIVRQVKYGQQLVKTSHAQQNIAIANKIRKQHKQQQPYPIVKKQQKVQQYLFYQICYSNSLVGKQIQKIKNSLPFPYDERNMLVFLCHGFQASAYDMKLIQRGIKQALPLAEVYTSIANEDDTQCDIGHMGKRLSEEIMKKIRLQNLNEDDVILNFVGHSMGGIIARAALKYLQKFQKQFGFFCSLSSPHLGYSNGTDNMIKAGLWIMRKMMKQPRSLDQLSMSDASTPEKSFLYSLSSEGSLKSFKKIILISSAEDSYVPWHSARISPYDKKSSNQTEMTMANNIIGDSTVHRIDVNFACEKGDLDGFIGRKAHINLIVNDTIFKLINEVIPNLFDIRKI